MAWALGSLTVDPRGHDPERLGALLKQLLPAEQHRHSGLSLADRPAP